MRSLVRALMLWLVVLALPAQGFAAATMTHCGHSSHERLSSADMHHHGDEESGSDDHADTVADGHDMGVADASESSHAHDGASTSKADLHKAKAKCSACAACCATSALPTASIVFPSTSPSAAIDFFVPTSRVGFLTEGPERPPRAFPA